MSPNQDKQNGKQKKLIFKFGFVLSFPVISNSCKKMMH